ncbi:restriction endonuclease subunit S [Iodobacter arcticus]|uniref:Restriction endonuclease subunit S n=1 Tax=Iodobacter arcticus TaxID=590593 RepID=A0ABW2R378_9NEIS
MNSKPVTVFAARTAIGPFGSRMKSDAYTDSGVPVIRGTNLTGGKVLSGEWVYVSEKTADGLSNCCVYPGDLVFPHRGAIGEVGIVPEQFNRYVMSSSLMTLSCDRSKADPDYIYYFFKSAAGRHELLKNASQVGTPGIGQPLSTLRSIKVPLPPLQSQRSIAKILGDLDSKINLNHRINQTLEAIAQAIFKSWFVDFDPVKAKIAAKQEGRDPLRAAMCAISGKIEADLDALPREQYKQLAATAALFPNEMEESEGIPKGWKQATLIELTTKIGSGATPRGGKDVYLENGVALIRSQNVYDSTFVWSGLARISDNAAQQLKNVEIKSSDVLLNITGASILRSCVAIPDVLPARVNQHVAIIRPKENIPSRFIHLHLLQRKTKDYLLGLNTGGSREAVTKAHIESTPIIRPTDPVLAAFQRATNAIYLGNESLARQDRSLAELRDTLLPKLLSGELSVTDALTKVEA